MSLPQDLQIGGEYKRAALGGLSPLNQCLHEPSIFHHVKLEPEGLIRRARNIFNGANAHGGQGIRHTELGSRSGRFDLAISVLKTG